MECKKSLEEAGGDLKKAQAALKESGLAKALKKKDRETKQGLVHAYIHHGEKIGSLVKVTCETDFVARTPEFKQLVHDIAMQAAALKPQSVEELLESEFIKEAGKKMSDLVIEAVAKLGENVKVESFTVYEV